VSCRVAKVANYDQIIPLKVKNHQAPKMLTIMQFTGVVCNLWLWGRTYFVKLLVQSWWKNIL